MAFERQHNIYGKIFPYYFSWPSPIVMAARQPSARMAVEVFYRRNPELGDLQWGNHRRPGREGRMGVAGYDDKEWSAVKETAFPFDNLIGTFQRAGDKNETFKPLHVLTTPKGEQ